MPHVSKPRRMHVFSHSRGIVIPNSSHQADLRFPYSKPGGSIEQIASRPIEPRRTCRGQKIFTGQLAKNQKLGFHVRPIIREKVTVSSDCHRIGLKSLCTTSCGFWYLLKKKGEVGCCGRATPVHNTPHPDLLKRYGFWGIYAAEPTVWIVFFKVLSHIWGLLPDRHQPGSSKDAARHRV